MAYTLIDYNNKAKDYDDLPSNTSQGEFDKKYDDKTRAADLAWIGIGLFAASYIANWIDILFISKSEFDIQETALTHKGNYLSINLLPSTAFSRNEHFRVILSYKINF